jgi:acyl CoA:acetate/3-ketoacid CoA transferase
VAEGPVPKIVEHLEQVSYSADRALRSGQHVRYVTERAVFELTADGLVLLEVAPGVDPDADVAARLPFPVDVAGARPMAAELFGHGPMRLPLAGSGGRR